MTEAKPATDLAMGIARWVDERLGAAHFVRKSLDKAFPDNWSFLLGEIALYCFVVLVVTGTFLALFFDASSDHVVYHGSYHALSGVTMSEAYRSVIELSFDVRLGLMMRQMHHWAALLFVGSIVAHLGRVFFTGAFRKPREINWLIGCTLLLLALANGFSGYSLPDDLLSGTGLRIAYSIVLSVPVVGSWLAFLLFGGEYPAHATLGRLFVAHVYIVPLLIFGLLSAHLAIIWRQKHTQFPGPGRTEQNVVGSPLWPTYAAKSVGMGAFVVATCALLGGLVQINPVWLYGPYDPASVTTDAQPDYYVGWLEGALRLAPPWLVRIGRFTIPEVFWPGVVLPGIVFGLLYAWPFLERRVTRDRATHHLLDRPRNRAVRTAIGVAALSFFAVLTLAGGQDVIAEQMRVSVTNVTLALRIMLVAAPVIAGAITWKWCHDLQAGDEQMHVHVGPGERNSGAGIAPEPRDEHVARDVTAAGARSRERRGRLSRF
ncbi:MAG: ubiquinol-cytochrome c reductase cytochrome b subunit, partial [Actinomycetota bacterium]|nr:ubiquinol-cytochrome c reductase cytochrome b subunit [Actinomycetota bacterium]